MRNRKKHEFRMWKAKRSKEWTFGHYRKSFRWISKDSSDDCHCSPTYFAFLFADSYNHNIKTGLSTALTITKHSQNVQVHNDIPKPNPYGIGCRNCDIKNAIRISQSRTCSNWWWHQKIERCSVHILYDCDVRCAWLCMGLSNALWAKFVCFFIPIQSKRTDGQIGLLLEK